MSAFSGNSQVDTNSSSFVSALHFSVSTNLRHRVSTGRPELLADEGPPILHLLSLHDVELPGAEESKLDTGVSESQNKPEINDSLS